MLLNEAKWLGDAIHSCLSKELNTILNIGSQTLEFREKHQAYLTKYVTAPLIHKGASIVNVDIQSGNGIDVTGDICSPDVNERLRKLHPHAAMCCNLLEHVPDIDRIAAAIREVLPVGGVIIASCPLDYPYHPDPIDNRFRPTVAELAAKFPRTRLIRSAIVDCGTLGKTLGTRRYGVMRCVIRSVLPIWKPQLWRRDFEATKWMALRKRVSASCCVLEAI